MSRQQFALDYIDVAERIVEFRTKHPEGSLQQVALDFREVNGGWWVVYTAAAYRTPDDLRPGIGTAWEPIPGKTNFTRDNEVQNAETAAWGRAIVASLAADTKRGVASAEEVRNSRDRQEARQAPPAGATSPPPAGEQDVDPVAQALADLAMQHVVQEASVDALKTAVYDQAKAKRLLSAWVADSVTGERKRLSDVIADAKATLIKQTEAAA